MDLLEANAMLFRNHQQAMSSLELAGSGNHDLGTGGTGLGSDTFDGLDNVHAFDNLSENNVLSVKPGGLGGTEEELTSVGIRQVEAFLRMGFGQGHRPYLYFSFRLTGGRRRFRAPVDEPERLAVFVAQDGSSLRTNCRSMRRFRVDARARLMALMI